MLQLSYKTVFGRTIRDDIVEMRLERAKKLLVDTDMPVLRIPEQCGSDAPNHFLRLFKERTGMTMLQWRRNHPTDSSCGEWRQEGLDSKQVPEPDDRVEIAVGFDRAF